MAVELLRFNSALWALKAELLLVPSLWRHDTTISHWWNSGKICIFSCLLWIVLLSGLNAPHTFTRSPRVHASALSSLKTPGCVEAGKAGGRTAEPGDHSPHSVWQSIDYGRFKWPARAEEFSDGWKTWSAVMIIRWELGFDTKIKLRVAEIRRNIPPVVVTSCAKLFLLLKGLLSTSLISSPFLRPRAASALWTQCVF